MPILRDLFCPDNCACLLCGQECEELKHYICPNCAAALRPSVNPAPPDGLDGLTAGLCYDGGAAKAVKDLKFNEGTVYADFLAQFMMLPSEWSADYIVPVPLHPWRELWRGYNQSTLLAECVAKKSAVPVNTKLLLRTRYTAPQSRLGGRERKHTMSRAFEASAAARDKVIVLVDDVCTTGTTLSACAAALRKAGARRIYAVCATAAGR